MRHKSVAEERPEIGAQWAPINKLSPDQVSCGSHLKVWWICSEGHQWQATVKNRALLGSGCPYCEHRAVLKGYNDLKTLFPKIAKTWSPKNKLKPSEVSSRSNTEVLWKCKNGHEWKARVADRTEGHGCPYCSGQRVWKGFNDLETTHPELSSEWSDKNNGITPDTITYKNRSNVWWHCPKCGNDYQAVVYAKANGRICPYCVATEIKMLRNLRQARKEIAQDFNYLLPQLAAIYYAGKLGLKVMINSDHLIGIPVTAYIPSISLIIDVCTSEKERKLKGYICDVNRIKYVSVPRIFTEEETITLVRKAFSDVHVYSTTSSVQDLEIIKQNYTRWKSKS